MISAGVLGSPINHSLSPLLHQAAYEMLGIEARYRAYEVKAGELANFISTKGFELQSLSLTMPLKEEALEIADYVSDISRQIASGNTLRKVDGDWNLTSTDVEGFTFALQTHHKSAAGNVLIIGSGATARAVAAACNGVSDSLTVLHRNKARSDSMRQSAPELELDFHSWEADISFDSFDLVVNTTPGDSASVFKHRIGSKMGIFFEVLYNPWPTALLSTWRENGNFAIDGLDLLIHQAISQVEIFSSQRVERDVMAKKLRLVGESALS